MLDSLFNHRIGLGKAQCLSISCLGLMNFNNGMQLILTSLMIPVVKQEWHLSSQQVRLMTAAFYIGVLLGALLTGKLSDTYGRKPVMLGGELLKFLSCCSFALVHHYPSLLVARVIYGFTFGASVPLASTMFSQIVPCASRGKGLLLINYCLSVGKMVAVGIASQYLDTIYKGNWRGMLVASSFSSVLVVGGASLMHESPRFLLASGQFQQTFLVLDSFLQQNSKPLLTDEECDRLVHQHETTFSGMPTASIKELFSKRYLATTVFLFGSWFMINFMDSGQLTILPFIFGQSQTTFASYALTLLGEAPTILMSMALIDRPGFGRKRSLTLFFLFAGVAHALFSFKQLALFSSVARFSMKLCFQMLFAFTTESYGTLVRTIGLGFGIAASNTGSTLMPFIAFPLLSYGRVYVILSFVAASVLGAIMSHHVPQDTLGSSLDNNQPVTEQ